MNQIKFTILGTLRWHEQCIIVKNNKEKNRVGDNVDVKYQQMKKAINKRRGRSTNEEDDQQMHFFGSLKKLNSAAIIK